MWITAQKGDFIMDNMDNMQIPTPDQQQNAFPDVSETSDLSQTPQTSEFPSTSEIPVNPVNPDMPQTPEEPEGPKKAKFAKALLRPKVLLPIILACIVIIAGAFAVSANTDKAVTESAFANMFDRVTEGDFFTMLEKGMEKGKFSFSVGEDSELRNDVSADYGNPFFSLVQFDLELWATSDKGVARISGYDHDGIFYASWDGMWFSGSMFEDTYTLPFDKLSKRMEDSEIYSDYIEPYLNSTEAKNMFDLYVNYFENSEEAHNDAVKYLEKYAKFFKDELWENGEVEDINDSGNRVITLTIDEEAISETLRAFFEKAAKDKSFLKFLDTYLDLELIEIGDYDSWKEIFKDTDLIDDACDALESTDFKIKLEVTASSVLHKMKNLKISLTADGAKAAININMEDKDSMSLKLTFTQGGETLNVANVKYSTSKEGFKLTVNAYDTEVAKISFVKKDGGKYKMTISTGESDPEFTLTGKYESNKKHFLFSVDEAEVEYRGETQELTLDITFECEYNAKMPAFPKNSKDILELDEDDFEAIGQQFNDFIDEISDSMFEDDDDDYNYYGDYD